MSNLAGPIAYLTGEYPRATDTFIQREVAALRELGFEVETCSIRRTGAEHHTGPEQKQEAARTFNTLRQTAKPMVSLRAHFEALKEPKRYAKAAWLAFRTAPAGLRGKLFGAIYFAEAVVLAAHLRAIKARHLHNHIAKASCTVAMITGELTGISWSFTMHGPDDFFAPEHWRLDEKIKRAAFVACISEFCRSQGMLFSDRAHWSKLHIVHCGIDPARYSVGQRQGKNLLFVGRLAAVKGIPVLFEALQIALKTQPDLHLTLIGDGPERMALETEARQLGLSPSLSFVGYQSQTAVAKTLEDTDCLVLPSFAEGVPVVLMEAMAASVPVIATSVGGVGELVENKTNGILVAPGDAAALAEAIMIMLHPDAPRAEMGASGRAKVCADFELKVEAARLASLFAATMDPSQPSLAKRPAPMPAIEPAP
ncbi:MAG: glycosyltransferase family 4 protein [Rhodobacteraceae bacterium]|nr:glycosyltransferase family 4 protein [Paracoccaceae bacterium]